MFDVLMSCAAAISALMVSVWILSLVRRDVSIVDIAWGLGFVLVAWTAYGVHRVQPPNLLLPVLTTLWGIRLSGYLFWRNHGKPEDYRYRAMRKKMGRSLSLGEPADRLWAARIHYVDRLAADSGRRRSCW